MQSTFQTKSGRPVSGVTATEMQTIDRIAVEEVGLSLLQMMEHAGRNLARVALDSEADSITVLAGRGGNGGGGLACARHLTNRGRLQSVVCSRDREAYEGAPETQLNLLEAMAVPITYGESTLPDGSDLFVDALIGYGLTDHPRGVDADLIRATTESETPTISLDVPSGVDATTGETPGVAIDPTQTLTLALPKTGLTEYATEPATVLLGDLGIPDMVYEMAKITDFRPFGSQFIVPLERSA